MNAYLPIIAAACLAAGISLSLAVGILIDKRQQQQMKNELTSRIIAADDAGSASQAPLAKPKKAQRAAKWRLPGGRLPSFGPGRQQKGLLFDQQLVVLLDITALGMRAGMAFDQAFELSLQRSTGELPELCLAQLEIWQKGLVTREQGLHDLEKQVQTVLFSRFVSLVLRAIRYGAPMTQLLSALAEESRRDIRARREEEVAKAPVKMLIPTGVLILPAMLLLVLGPIILDLIGKM
ncbi:MAG: type II secretion system F family protein [Coriobacteriia bacterium]|nr:type II secretion system F family protein [Coriobacteriia bacterium]